MDIQFKVDIKATPQRVWQALVEEANSWWPSRYYLGEAPRGFVLEGRVGGRVYEDWGGGQGLLWSTVIAVQHGKLLQIVGDAAPENGGPCRTISTFVLQPDGDATVIRFRNSTTGKVDEKTLKNLDTEWTILLEDCFKPYVEEGKLPERPPTVVEAEGRRVEESKGRRV